MLLHVQFSHHNLLKKLSFLGCMILPPFSQIRYPWVCGFISGLLSYSIGLYFLFFFLCQYHTVLMTVALQYSLRSGKLIPRALCLFLKTVLAIRGVLCFHSNCENFCSNSVKNTIGSMIGIALNQQIALGSIAIFTTMILPI